MRDGGQPRCNGTQIDLDKISIFRHNLVLREIKASWYSTRKLAYSRSESPNFGRPVISQRAEQNSIIQQSVSHRLRNLQTITMKSLVSHLSSLTSHARFSLSQVYQLQGDV